MSKKEARKFLLIFLRYFFLLAFALFAFNFPFFYEFFLRLTIYPLNFLLNLFYNSSFSNNLIAINGYHIELIPACIAIAAYFLLLTLNLTTPMNPRKRIYSVIFSFLIFLLFNIARLFFLSLLFINSNIYFEQIHMILWYSINILFVLIAWFLTVYLFKIKNIPVYQDFKSLFLNLEKRRIKRFL